MSINHVEYESNGGRNMTPSLEEYLYKIKLYLKDIINHLKNSDTWEIQITIAIRFISSKDSDEEHVIHLKSDNILEIFINDNVMKEVFK